MLSNPGLIKLDLLSKGIRFDNSATEKVGSKYTEKRYMFGYSDRIESPPSKIPPEVIIEDEIIVAVHQRANSPYCIVKNIEDDSYSLKHNDEYICKVLYPDRPTFYGEKLSSGDLIEEVVTMYGVHILAYFVRGFCEFYVEGKQCGFCSLNPTRKIAKDAIMKITPEIAAEACQVAFELYGNQITYIMYCGGSRWDHDREVREYLKIAKEVNYRTQIPDRVRQHILSMPPYDLSLLKEMKDVGMNDCAFALEVWNPDMFRKVCPGKYESYGREQYLKAFEFAVKIFGEGNVFCVLVGGIEPLNSLIDGFQELAKMGVTPSVNVCKS